MKWTLLLITLSLSISTMAQENPSVDNFSKGVNSFKQKNYSESHKHFTNIVKGNPQSVSGFYNLGLVEYNLGNLGKARAYWKKTLSLSPLYSEARKSLNLLKSKLPAMSNNSLWEKFRYNILSLFSIEVISIFFTIFFIGCFANLIKHFTRRHIALKNHLPMPKTNKFTYLFTGLFLLLSCIFFSKIYDYSNPRAIIITDVSSMYLSPTEEDIKIRELSQGDELIIFKNRNEWLQAKTISGNIGWIKKKDTLQVSGAQIQ